MSTPQQAQPQPQTPDARKVVSDGEDFSDTVNEISNFEYSDANKTATSSSHQDSEYDTASDSQSSDEPELRNRRNSGSILDNDDEILSNRARKLSIDDTNDADGEAGDDEYDVRTDDDSESGSIILDLERQRGDGEEDDEEIDPSKKVDDDEDRSNPQYIPKRGVFYEHDDRTADDIEAKDGENEEPAEPVKKPLKKTSDKWAHDFYDESEQAPKSRTELVNSYGYDIRNEDGPPKTRRNRRYNRGPTKYTRKWEDESAYGKSNAPVRNPRPEDFPELGSKIDRRSKSSQLEREEKENKTRQAQYMEDERNYAEHRRGSNRPPSDRGDGDRHDRRGTTHNSGGYSSSNRSGRDGYSDERRVNKDMNYRSGRNSNSIVIKNQNRNKNNDNYESRGGNNRNNSASNSDRRNIGDDEHVKSISFTNSKLNNNPNRYAGVEYSNIGSSIQERDYADAQATNPQRPITGRQPLQNQSVPVSLQQQQQQQQQSQSDAHNRHKYMHPSAMPTTNLDMNLEPNNQPPNTMLATNHTLPIAAAIAGPMNQTIHNPGIGQVQQQDNNLKGHGSKRYSNQRNRTNVETQGQTQPQAQQLPINVVQQPQNAQAQVPQPQPGVVPTVSAQTQYQPNFYANEYPAINPPQTPAQYGQPAFIGYPSEMNQQLSGSAYIQQTPPPQAPSVGVVPQMMNFVPTHPPIQAPPVVQPVPSAQNQYPSFPYPSVQNYNSASGITYYAPQTQPPPRPILSQRRPKNAIPIMAPPERSGKSSHNNRSGGNNTNMDNSNMVQRIVSGGNMYSGDESGHEQQLQQQQQQHQQQQQTSQQSSENATENIDHILDNMFVQRPHPYQSATGLGESTTNTSSSPPIEVQKIHGADMIEIQEKTNTDIASSASLQKDESDQQQASSSLVAI